jgi:hypothetical protein
MRTFIIAASLATLCAFSGCENPGKAYANAHPELSPEHRKIMVSGKIKYGDSVAGMTREQVRLIMGKDPDQFDSVNGEDAWIWIRAKNANAQFETSTSADNGGVAKDGGGGKREPISEAGGSDPFATGHTKTTVFFKGNVATHVDVRSGGTL